LRCAARGTEKYSSKPVASHVVSELVAEQGLPKPEGCRRLNSAGLQAVEMAAQKLAAMVDQALGPVGRKPAQGSVPAGQATEATCSCGSGILVRRVEIDGQVVELVALDPIFRKFRDAGRGTDEATLKEVFEMVKVYNDVPPAAEAAYREAIRREFAAYCR